MDTGGPGNYARGRQDGRKDGRKEGKGGLIERQIKKRFGPVPEQMTERLNQLSVDQLDALGEALFDFASPADLETWLSSPPRH